LSKIPETTNNKKFSIPNKICVPLISARTQLLLGTEIYQKAPPTPKAVTSFSGEMLATRSDIETGQNVWQSIGGMEQGSIWGHGSYLAPDWSANRLHREAETLLALRLQAAMPGLSHEGDLAL
jgi:nitric oxide reductase subunit B